MAKAERIPTEPPPDLETTRYGPQEMRIPIHALRVKQTGENEFDIYLPAHQVSVEDNAVLARLFPNTERMVERALLAEAMLEAIGRI